MLYTSSDGLCTTYTCDYNGNYTVHMVTHIHVEMHVDAWLRACDAWLWECDRVIAYMYNIVQQGLPVPIPNPNFS